MRRRPSASLVTYPVTAGSRADPIVIALHGELGVATNSALREQLLRALHRTDRLILDLAAVTRCDISTLAVLVGTQRRARLLGTTFHLAAPGPELAALLNVTGLDRSLTILPTLARALGQARADGLRPVQAA
ncbi:MAG: STAS domain-containing protein [Streptosporangiales bacterium]|nr:STAS domain-containing protein [Streptosporangiales bacterium]